MKSLALLHELGVPVDTHFEQTLLKWLRSGDVLTALRVALGGRRTRAAPLAARVGIGIGIAIGIDNEVKHAIPILI